jgi:hypothetical protein
VNQELRELHFAEVKKRQEDAKQRATSLITQRMEMMKARVDEDAQSAHERDERNRLHNSWLVIIAASSRLAHFAHVLRQRQAYRSIHTKRDHSASVIQRCYRRWRIKLKRQRRDRQLDICAASFRALVRFRRVLLRSRAARLLQLVSHRQFQFLFVHLCNSCMCTNSSLRIY